jgi:hypothetical protein
MKRWLQASKLIHENSQVEICGPKGFPTEANHPLHSRISYRYSDPESPLGPTIGEPGGLGHQWYYASPSSQNFL